MRGVVGRAGTELVLRADTNCGADTWYAPPAAREYEKLHQQVRRVSQVQQAQQGGGSGDFGAATVPGSSPSRSRGPSTSPTRGRATPGNAWGGSSGKRDVHKAGGRVVGHYTHTLAGATVRRKRRPNKQEVRGEHALMSVACLRQLRTRG